MTVLQRQLGRRLRKLREAARKTEYDVEESGLASRRRLKRIELGHQAVKAAEIRDLCVLYGTDIATTDMLARWAITSKHQDWWEDFDEPLSTRAGLYAGLEATADRLYIYELGQVPYLLQTPDYSRAHYLAVNPDATSAAVDRYLDHLQGRQTAWTQRTPPVPLTAILNEDALSRAVGGPDAMREQIRRLPELANQVNIDIRYLPWRVGVHPAMAAGGFTILDFIDDDDPDVVYAETHIGARYLELRAELEAYRRIFTGIYAISIPVSEYRPQPGSLSHVDPPVHGEVGEPA